MDEDTFKSLMRVSRELRMLDEKISRLIECQRTQEDQLKTISHDFDTRIIEFEQTIDEKIRKRVFYQLNKEASSKPY